MRGGWSSHFEFREDELRVRTDFFTRPPRISKTDLTRIWDEQEGRDIPFLDPPELAEMKKTNRERDYAVIGELARLMHRRPELELLNSRSARDLIRLSREHPDVSERLTDVRPLLEFVSEGRERLEQELDAERRRLIRLNEARLKAYGDASIDWYALWPSVAEETAGLSLREAHEIVVRRADGVLPTAIEPSRGRA